MKKNSIFNVIRKNETSEGFLDVTGYISEADKPMEYIDYWEEKVTREIIPLEELEKALPQANGLILTDLHPWEFLNAKNASEYTKGFVVLNHGIEDKKLKVDLRIINSDLINDVRRGEKTQFSIGYLCNVIEEPGVTENGESYDLKQVDLKLNHVALVPKGRAGDGVGIITLNSADENISYQRGMYKKNSEDEGGQMKVKYNGKEMEATEILAELMSRDNELKQKINEVDSLSGQLTALKTTNEELTQKINEMANSKDKELTERLNALTEVAELTGVDTKELVKLNTVDLKKKVINTAFPTLNLEGKSEAYLDGLYEGAKEKLNSSTLPTETEGKEQKKENTEDSSIEKALEGIRGGR